jgi:glyoxylase-like metal-dependent hydrolase (beta-lactamase superfamily II)
MEIYSLIAENWKTDAGASFGVVPKSIWSKLYHADDNNMVNVTSRCLLVKNQHRLILFDTGMGNKQDEKFFKHRQRFGSDNLVDSLKKLGFDPNDVTDIVFTHLHYDHCGGATAFNSDKTMLELVFPNAQYHVSKRQWDWAMTPNIREAASYLPENLLPIKDSGKLNFITQDGWFDEGIYLRMVHGHTDGQLIPVLHYKNKVLVFTADFIPSAAHVPLVWLTAYDIRPLEALAEKEAFLNVAVKNDYTLLFLHDYDVECCKVAYGAKGYEVARRFTLNDFLTIDL